MVVGGPSCKGIGRIGPIQVSPAIKRRLLAVSWANGRSRARAGPTLCCFSCKLLVRDAISGAFANYHYSLFHSSLRYQRAHADECR